MEQITATLVANGFTGIVGYVTEEGVEPCVIKTVNPTDKLNRFFVHSVFDFLMEFAKEHGATFNYQDEQLLRIKK